MDQGNNPPGLELALYTSCHVLVIRGKISVFHLRLLAATVAIDSPILALNPGSGLTPRALVARYATMNFGG